LAEKYLKAYLVFEEQESPKTHALEDLVLLAAVKDPGCKKLITLASELVLMLLKSGILNLLHLPYRTPVKPYNRQMRS
jgi:HEPN domain-containing protein